MKVVKFQDGKFGVRKWFFGYKFFDLKSYQQGYVWWWDVRVDYFLTDCRVDSELVAIACMNKYREKRKESIKRSLGLVDKGTPV